MMLALGGSVLVGCSSEQESQEVSSEPVVEPQKLTEAEASAGVLTPEVLWKFGRLGGLGLSPGGKRVLYTVTHYDVARDKGGTRIYTQGIEEATPTLVCTGGFAPQWRPDGGRIGFLQAVGGVVQIFEMNPDGTAVKQLSDFKDGVESFWYSPDGRRLLYSQMVQVQPTTQELYPGMDKANVRIIDSLMYRHWNYWVDGRFSHLFLAEYSEAGVKEGQDIMPNEPWDAPMSPYFDGAEVSFSPSGDAVFYTCKKLTDREYAVSTNSSIYRYEVGSGQTKNLTQGNPGYDRNPVISPDGSKMLWQRMVTPGYESDRARLMCMDLSTGQVAELSKDYDNNVETYEWSKDGKTVYFLSSTQGTRQLFELNVQTLAISQITDGQWNINWMGRGANQEWILQRTQMNRAAELYRLDSRGAMEPFTHINDEIYSKIAMSKVEARWMETTDGGKMLTWVVYPPNFDSCKKYPTLLYCQGGPQSTVSQFWSYRWNFQIMASQGYVVVAPNRHGVPSFGQEWNAQISGDYSGQNIKDYLTAIDNIAKEPWCDKEHLGAVGASYGGYSVYYLAGVHEGRFKAFIAHNGMFNFESFYAATEETFFPNHDFGGPYWDKNNKVAQRSYAHSPHHFVQHWDTPIMIVVGEHDFRIPYTEGIQAFNAARLLGVPAHLLVYPTETHFVTKPQNAVIWQHEFFKWLDRWLKK